MEASVTETVAPTISLGVDGSGATEVAWPPTAVSISKQPASGTASLKAVADEPNATCVDVVYGPSNTSVTVELLITTKAETPAAVEAPEASVEQSPTQVEAVGPHDNVPGDDFSLSDGQKGTDRLNGQPSDTAESSAPPARALSGVPLDEDKAAGVTPGPQPPVVQEGKAGPEVAPTPGL